MSEPAVNILLVEDDEVDLRAVQRDLERLEIRNPLHIARDGIEALQMLRGENGRVPVPGPHLVLLDLRMPRMNGIEFLKQLRADADLRQTIVFVLTTSENEDDKLAAYDQQVSSYLLKSRLGDEFLRALRLMGMFLLTMDVPPD